MEEVGFRDSGKGDGCKVGSVGVCCAAHEGVELAGDAVEEVPCLGEGSESIWYIEWSSCYAEAGRALAEGTRGFDVKTGECLDDVAIDLHLVVCGIGEPAALAW